MTFRDYGLGWDDYTHAQYGDLLLKLYGSGFADRRALSFVNLYKYGGGFDMAAPLSPQILTFDIFLNRPVRGAVFRLIGLIATVGNAPPPCWPLPPLFPPLPPPT